MSGDDGRRRLRFCEEDMESKGNERGYEANEWPEGEDGDSGQRESSRNTLRCFRASL